MSGCRSCSGRLFHSPKTLHFSTTLWFNPPMEGFHWDDLRKILPGCRQVTNVLNGAETLQKISIGWVGCKNVTDRQTDGRTTTYSEHEHEFTFAKNLLPVTRSGTNIYRLQPENKPETQVLRWLTPGFWVFQNDQVFTVPSFWNPGFNP